MKQRTDACYPFRQTPCGQRNPDDSAIQQLIDGAGPGGSNAEADEKRAGSCMSGIQPNKTSNSVDNSDYLCQMSENRTFNHTSAFTCPVRSSAQSNMVTIDTLSADMHDTLKMSEQQHAKIDATRLSAVIDSFDPLSQENTVGILPGECRTLYLDGRNSNPDELLGTRPKIPNCEAGTMPRIAFVRDSMDEGNSRFDRGGTSDFQNVTLSSNQSRSRQKFPFLESGIEPLSSSNYNPFGECRRAPELPPRNSASSLQDHSSDGLSNGPLVDITTATPPRPSQLEVSCRSSTEVSHCRYWDHHCSVTSFSSL